MLGWGTWNDVLVDFGWELYVPWRITQGQVAFPPGASGPLSPWWNALLFQLLGPGLSVLVVANLAVLVAVVALLYALLGAATDRLGATAGALAFVLLHALGRILWTGNYSYAAPYSHGATHGMALALACLWVLVRAGPAPSRRALAAAGLLLGGVALTKPELLVACAAAVAVRLAVLARAGGGPRAAARLAGWVIAPALAVPAAAFLLLLAGAGLGPAAALEATLGPWGLAASGLPATAFYLSLAGLDRPAERLVEVAAALAAWAALLGGAAALDRAAGRLGPRARAAVAVAAAAAVAAGGVALADLTDAWDLAARPLPLVAAVAAAVLLLRSLRRPGAAGGAEGAALVLATFSAGLLAKVPLAARVDHYGFLLTGPAVALAVAALASAAPRALRARGGAGVVLTAAALSAFGTWGGLYQAWVAPKVRATLVARVGEGRDAFAADVRGWYVEQARRWLASSARPGDTLAVLPEGIMVNYLARLENPSGFSTALPDAIAAYGEDRLLRAYLERPPDLVLVLARDASEHGARTFGVDYGRRLGTWLRTAYAPVARWGADPFEGTGEYGALMLRRRAR